MHHGVFGHHNTQRQLHFVALPKDVAGHPAPCQGIWGVLPSCMHPAQPRGVSSKAYRSNTAQLDLIWFLRARLYHGMAEALLPFPKLLLDIR